MTESVRMEPVLRDQWKFPSPCKGVDAEECVYSVRFDYQDFGDMGGSNQKGSKIRTSQLLNAFETRHHCLLAP